MSAWRTDQSRDPFFQQAKRDNYRARSAYKLKEINQRCRLVRPGDAVVDLGAAPGSWSQILVELVGTHGQVVAVDINAIVPIASVEVIQGDIRHESTLTAIAGVLRQPAAVILSDVAPATTGQHFVDHARSIELADASLAAALRLMRGGGHFVVKVFRGEDFDAFVGRVRRSFAETRVVVPKATRTESREAYVVGLRRRPVVQSAETHVEPKSDRDASRTDESRIR